VVRAGKGRNGEEREGWHGCWYEFYDDSTIPLFFFFSFLFSSHFGTWILLSFWLPVPLCLVYLSFFSMKDLSHE
jgi:hypothetical protein